MEDEPKTEAFTFRISLPVLAKLRRLAHDKEMSASELVRRAVEVMIYAENLLEKRDLTEQKPPASLFEHV